MPKLQLFHSLTPQPAHPDRLVCADARLFRRSDLRRFFSLAALSLAFVVTACAAPTQPLPTDTPTGTPTLPPTATPTVTVTATPTSTPTITLTPTPDIAIHSPLEGVSLEELPEIDANAYAPPLLGKEDGHHGVDFSYWRYKDKIGMLGLPIYSVLPGTVAMADSNHKPYGNAVIIETPLKNLPQSWIDALKLPAAEPLWEMDTRLYCPKPTSEPAYSSDRSLYLLYAHLENPPEVTPGQTVAAGDTIGQVGHSGNAINDHLHLEVRVGPSDVKLPSMDHYDNGASDEVMWNYCTWRISGHFKLIDPMLLLSLKP